MAILMVILKKYVRLAILLALVGSALLSLGQVFVGIVVTNIGPATPLAFTSISQAILTVPVMLKKNTWAHTNKREWVLLLISSIFLAANLYTSFDANKRIPPVDSIAILQLETVMVAIIAHFWLKEYIGIYEIVLMITITIGVVLVCQPEFIFNLSALTYTMSSTYGFLEAFGSCILASIGFSIVRRLQDTDPFFISTVQGMVAAASMLPFTVYQVKSPENSSQWMYTLSGSIAIAIGNILLVISLSLEDGALVMVIFSSVVIFTTVFQVIFMNVYPNLISILGTIVMVIGITLMVTKTHLLKLCNRREYQNRSSGDVLDSEEDHKINMCTS